MSGSLDFEMDDHDGFVRVRGVGFWTAEAAPHESQPRSRIVHSFVYGAKNRFPRLRMML